MKSLDSKIGQILVGIYIILSAISIIYSRICNQGICDVGYLLIPSIPWIAWLHGGSFGLFAYIISIMINILILYFIGYVIELLINENKK